MPKVHRVGDSDSSGDTAVIGSPNVFVNGGPTVGGGFASALGVPDTVGVSDRDARAILSGRAAELAAGGDPDTNEALESYGGGSPGGVNPVDGVEGAIPAPNSDAAGNQEGNLPYDPERRPDSEWIIVQSHVDPAVLPDCWNKAVAWARSLQRPITLNSAYRSPEYNRRVGGARNSMHVQRKAIDVQWGCSSAQDRVDMIQKAIDAGFAGIGVYNGFIHVDIGAKRCWGPNGSYTGVFQQYKAVLRANGYNV